MPSDVAARPIRVVFLVFYVEAWDCLDGIYQRMLADPRFAPTVISIPRKLTGYEDFTDEPLISAFFTERGIAHERFAYDDSFIGLERLQEIDPDYVFLNYPWQRNYQPGYQIERLISFTRVCYVPYFTSSLVQEPAFDGIAPHQYTQPTHRLAHLIFLQDEEVASAFIEADYGNQIFRTGTPKIDALREGISSTAPEWPLDRVLDSGERPFRLLWGPHHSYGPNWLNFGVFADMCHDMLDFATRHPHIDIVLRPHPFMFGTLTDRDLMTPAELRDWQSAWAALPNTATNDSAGFTAIFLASDALLTDGISFLVEYPLVTGKPTIFWEKADHWAFTHTGTLAAEASVRVTTMAEFEGTLAAAQVGLLPVRSAEIMELLDYVSPYPGRAAASIVELVAEDFEDLEE